MTAAWLEVWSALCAAVERTGAGLFGRREGDFIIWGRGHWYAPRGEGREG